jgi:hypothetical protein
MHARFCQSRTQIIRRKTGQGQKPLCPPIIGQDPAKGRNGRGCDIEFI